MGNRIKEEINVKSMLLGLTLALTACTTTGDVLPAGKNTYMVTASGGSGPFSKNELDSAVIRANQFCSQKGKTATVESTDNHGVPGWTQMRSTVSFSCS